MKNCVQVFRSWRANKMDECKAYLWNAGKQLIAGVVSALGVAASFFFGVKMGEACSKLTNLAIFEEGKELVLDCWKKGSSLLYAMSTAAAVGIVVNTTQMNAETFQAIRHPIDTVKKAWYAAKANPMAAIKSVIASPITLTFRVASLLVAGPFQVVGFEIV